MQLRGRPLRVIVQPTKNKKEMTNKKITAEQISDLQNKCNMSYATTQEVATFFRNVTGNRNFFEPFLKEQLLERNRTLQNLFTVKKFQFVKIKK